MGLREETVFNPNEQEFKRILECLEDALLDAQSELRSPKPLNKNTVLTFGIKVMQCEVNLLKLRQAMEGT